MTVHTLRVLSDSGEKWCPLRVDGEDFSDELLNRGQTPGTPAPELPGDALSAVCTGQGRQEGLWHSWRAGQPQRN